MKYKVLREPSFGTLISQWPRICHGCNPTTILDSKGALSGEEGAAKLCALLTSYGDTRCAKNGGPSCRSSKPSKRTFHEVFGPFLFCEEILRTSYREEVRFSFTCMTMRAIHIEKLCSMEGIHTENVEETYSYH